jgi:crossover junction endodeoxyribonuclease RusA
VSHFDFWLPMPPSLNNAYFNAKGRGRVMSKAYRAWKDTAHILICAAVPLFNRIHGPVCVAIALPQKMRGDVDNRIKPILDALVASGRIDDDRNVIEVSAGKRLPDKDRAFVSVSASLRKAA